MHSSKAINISEWPRAARRLREYRARRCRAAAVSVYLAVAQRAADRGSGVISIAAVIVVIVDAVPLEGL